MDGIILDGLVSAVEIKTVDDIYTIINYLSIVSEEERKQLIRKIKRSILKNNFTIHISNKDPNAIYFKDYPNIIEKKVFYNDIYDLNGYLYAITGFLTMYPQDRLYLNQYCSQDILSVYNINQYKQLVQNERIVRHVDKILLDYSNKKILHLFDKVNISTLKISMLNCMLLDADTFLNIGKEHKSLNLLKIIISTIGFLPLDALGIIERLKQTQYKEETTSLQAYVKDVFLLSNQSVKLIQNIPIYAFSRCSCPSVYALLEQIKHSKDLILNNHTDYPLTLNIKNKRFILTSNEAIRTHDWLEPIITQLKENGLDRFRKRVGRRLYDTQIDMSKVYALRSANIIKLFIVIENMNILLGVKGRRCYIVTENKQENRIGLFPVLDVNTLNHGKMIMRRINFNSGKPEYDEPNGMLAVIESQAVELDKDNNLNINVKLKESNSYMNRYSEIHSILVENHKAGNIEAMKNDLCRLYALIHIIERDVTYSNKPVSPSVKADANKARMFAKNDIKQYLPFILEKDKNFDMASYFEQSDIKKELEQEYKIKINMLAVKRFFNML